jgi:signal transduction histidine kinase
MKLLSPWIVVALPVVFFLNSLVAAGQGEPSSRTIDSLETALHKTTDSLIVADLCTAIYNHYKYDELSAFAHEYDYLMRALSIYQRMGRWEKAAYVCKALGGIHYNRNQTDKALHYWTDALDLYTRAGSREGQARMLSNLSLIVPAKKEAYLRKAIALQTEDHDTLALATSIHNLASLYFLTDDLGEAERYYKESIHMAEVARHTPSQQAGYLWLGRVRQKQGRFEDAIRYVERSLSFNAMRELDDPNAILAYQTLSELYASVHDYAHAHRYQTKLLTLKEELYKEQNIRNILDLEARYDTEKKQEQIELLQANEASQARALEAEQKQKVYLAFFLAIMALSLALTGWLYVQARKNKARIEEQNAALVRLNKTKDRFFGIIAHDLRNPLVAFSGLFKLLFHYAAQGETQKLNALEESTHESIAEVNHLLDNLLDWAASQTGTLPYAPEPLSMQQVCAEILALFHQSAQAKGIRLTADVNGNLYLFADRNGVSTILRNLVSNAIKFTPDGGAITLSATTQDGHVQLKVADTGRGMEEQMLKTLFADAEKSSTAGTRGEKGTGLGIPLCREFAALNKGTIQVESKIHVGTTFMISLPLYRI